MKVFILSSHQQRYLHDSIQTLLQMRGIAVWIDAADDGREYSERLANWFDESDLIIALVTPDYVASEFLKEEWQIALQSPTPKLALRIQGQELPATSQVITVIECSDEAQAPQLVYEFIRAKRRMKVFISYSHTNAVEMRDLGKILKQSLNKVWVDSSSLKHGEDFSRRIRAEIEASDYFLLMWSRHARASRWVEQEWNHAFKLGKQIVPVLLDSTPLPMVLEPIHSFSSLRDEQLLVFFSIPP